MTHSVTIIVTLIISKKAIYIINAYLNLDVSRGIYKPINYQFIGKPIYQSLSLSVDL